jgi:hypothetical protein
MRQLEASPVRDIDFAANCSVKVSDNAFRPIRSLDMAERDDLLQVDMEHVGLPFKVDTYLEYIALEFNYRMIRAGMDPVAMFKLYGHGPVGFLLNGYDIIAKDGELTDLTNALNDFDFTVVSPFAPNDGKTFINNITDSRTCTFFHGKEWSLWQSSHWIDSYKRLGFKKKSGIHDVIDLHYLQVKDTDDIFERFAKNYIPAFSSRIGFPLFEAGMSSTNKFWQTNVIQPFPIDSTEHLIHLPSPEFFSGSIRSMVQLQRILFFQIAASYQVGERAELGTESENAIRAAVKTFGHELTPEQRLNSITRTNTACFRAQRLVSNLIKSLGLEQVRQKYNHLSSTAELLGPSHLCDSLNNVGWSEAVCGEAVRWSPEKGHIVSRNNPELTIV